MNVDTISKLGNKELMALMLLADGGYIDFETDASVTGRLHKSGAVVDANQPEVRINHDEIKAIADAGVPLTTYPSKEGSVTFIPVAHLDQLRAMLTRLLASEGLAISGPTKQQVDLDTQDVEQFVSKVVQAGPDMVSQTLMRLQQQCEAAGMDFEAQLSRSILAAEAPAEEGPASPAPLA